MIYASSFTKNHRRKGDFYGKKHFCSGDFCGFGPFFNILGVTLLPPPLARRLPLRQSLPSGLRRSVP